LIASRTAPAIATMRPEISILASLHLGIVLLSVLPGDIRFVERYQWLTNTVQNWHMFYSAYTFREQSHTVIADTGETFLAAPPGFADAEAKDLPIRMVSYLSRLRNPGQEQGYAAWVERLGEEVAARGGRSFVIEARSLRIRNFYYSRRDGELYKELVDELGPYRAGP
jgi:hypothetical protein